MQLDRLEVVIEAQSKKANAELDKMIGKLNQVSSVLGGLNSKGLSNLSQGIRQLSSAMSTMGGVKTTDFNRLSRNIDKLGSIDQASLYKTSNALRNFTNTMNSIGAVSDDAMKIGELSGSISKLGYVGVQRAITNLPQLSSALKDFIATVSSAPLVSQNIIDMTNAMANLASQGTKYGATVKGIASATNSLTRAQRVHASSSFSLTSQIAKLATVYYSLRRMTGFVGSSIEKSMDYIETVNLFQTSLKKIGMESAQNLGMEWGSASADAYANTFIERAEKFNDMLVDSLTLDPDLMKNYQAVFAQMTNSMNLVTESSMNISETFTMLGNDIASLWNIDTDKAMKKLQSGLAGQIRPLRELGIDISKTSLEMYALNYGIEDSVEKMSQAAKVQLRYLAIMEQAEVAFGDMAKTIESPGNQLRVLSQQWTNLSRSIGNVFLPTVSTVLPYINGVVIALRSMIDTLAIAMGYETPDYSDSNIYKDLTGDIGDMENVIEDTTEANERLKKSMMKWDELNILSEGKSLNINLGSGYKELDEAIRQKSDSYLAKFNEELSKMSNKANDIAENIKEFFKVISEKTEPTTKAFKKLWDEGLSKVANFTWDNIKNFYSDFLKPIGEWTLGEGLPRLADVGNKLLNSIDWDKLSGAFKNLYDALAPFAIAVGEGLLIFIESMGEVLEPVLATTADLLAKALDWLADTINKIPTEVAVAVGGAIGGIATAVLMFKTGTAVAGIIDKIKLALVGEKGFITLAKTHPLFAVAAGLAAIGSAIITYETFKFNSSEFGKLVKAIDQYNTEVDEMFEKFDLTQAEIEAKFGGIQLITDKYFELAEQPFLSEENKQLLIDYANILTETFPELKPLIDEQTGAYKGTKEEIQGIIDKLHEKAQAEAKQEFLKELYKELYEGQLLLKDMQIELEEATNDYSTAMLNGKTNVFGFNKELKETSGRMSIAKIKVDETKTSIENIQGKIKDLTGETKELGTTTETSMGEIKTSMGEADTSTAEFVASAYRNFDKLGGHVDGAKDKVGKFVKYTKEGLATVEDKFGETLKGVSSAVSKFSVPAIKIPVTIDDSNLRSYNPQFNVGANTTYRVQAYATGGYPEMGQLFLAREAGPELVGNIGSKTAVANNDQIVQAVSQGVAMAVASVMGSSGGKAQVIENVMYLDSDVVYRSFNKAKNSNDMRFNPVMQGG